MSRSYSPRGAGVCLPRLAVGFATVISVCLPAGLLAQTELVCSHWFGGYAYSARAEGYAEPLDDIVLSCVGGTAGVQQTATFILNFPNSNPTVRMIAGAPESLVLVDEPSPGTQALGANVFRATRADDTLIGFEGVRIVQPGPTATRTLRFTNLRANGAAAQLRGEWPANEIRINLAASSTLPISVPSQITAGYAAPGLLTNLRTPDDEFFGGLALRQCDGLNAALVDSTAATGAQVTFSVKFTEPTIRTFHKRIMTDASGTFALQNTPGQFTGTESLFYNPALAVGGGYDQIGLATQGTRLMAKFSGIPAGVRLFATTTGMGHAETPGGPALAARLASIDVNGRGPFVATPGTTSVVMSGTQLQIAPLTISSGTATAVWEILEEDTNSPESVRFGIVVAYKPTAATGQVTVTQSFAPISATIKAITDVPRFSVPSTGATSMGVFACSAPLPDLIVADVYTPATVGGGEDFVASATIVNSGNAASQPTEAKLAIVDSQNAEFDTDRCTIAALAPGESALCSVTLRAPNGVLDSAALLFTRTRVDEGAAVIESNEANNTRIVPMTVTPCTYSVTPSHVALLGTAGSSQTVAVTTGPGCFWLSGFNGPSWVNYLPPGWGPKLVTIVATASNPGATRSGTFDFGVATNTTPLTVTQAPETCTYWIHAPTQVLPSAGGSASVDVTTQAGCPWTPSSTAGWLSFGSAYAEGSGSVIITVGANIGTARSAAATIMDQTLTINQAAASTPATGLHFIAVTPCRIADTRNATGPLRRSVHRRRRKARFRDSRQRLRYSGHGESVFGQRDGGAARLGAVSDHLAGRQREAAGIDAELD